MDIHLNAEFIAAIGTAMGTFAVAFLWLLVKFVRHLSSFADAMERNAQVNATINDELLSVVKDRKTEREQWDTERQKWQSERVELRTATTDLAGQVRIIQEGCAAREQEMIKEIADLRAKIVSLEGEISRLERELRIERENRRTDLRTFEIKLREKDEQIAALKEEREALRVRLTNLESAMNGKVDKPSTDDITASAVKVAQQLPKNENEEK